MELNNVDTILLIEDDPITSFIQTSLIRDMGFKGTIAEVLYADAALDYLKKTRTTTAKAKTGSLLILLDINMPFKDGFEFMDELEQMKDLYKENMHIVILSTSVLKVDLDRAAKYNLAGYLVKPLTEEKLLGLLETLEYS